jgi:hypothetical protein
MKGPRTYAQWERIRLSGRGGKKKVRRDTMLSKQEDGTLTFHYTGYKNKEHELLVTLTPDDTYTLSKDEGRYYPTFSNIFMFVVGVAVYSDASHYKHYAMQTRVGVGQGRWVKGDDGKWERAKSIPFTNGLQYRHGVCLNLEIAIDYKRKLNREKSLPLLRKTVVLAKVLRVATRLGVLERDRTKRGEFTFDMVNIDDPSAADAEIILHKGNAMGMWRTYMAQSPEEKQAALMRCAENGLADYREWLYSKHNCYDMVPVVYGTEPSLGETS